MYHLVILHPFFPYLTPPAGPHLKANPFKTSRCNSVSNIITRPAGTHTLPRKDISLLPCSSCARPSRSSSYLLF
ncbi:hypothetical protein CesoFtcFv8_020211 [Champsocephalus esox]|uniref:Uncharacterized protein n=1 Tax=Champsocephalus esox TaxID=159716 RepID=A0AAN8BEW6_9TELE|nr:hypothetical protein CesoFtcFv8_020211 [Champsocephalus esox]